MEKKSMTALISAFARAYHSENSDVKVFDDYMAKNLLSKEEYYGIGMHMSGGVKFFYPEFEGDQKDGLRLVVNDYLAPSPIGRAAFCEKALELSVRLGVDQYVILAAGYDTFAYRRPEWAKEIKVFELDHPLTSDDKKSRLKDANIIVDESTFYIDADLTTDLWTENLVQNKYFNNNGMSFNSMLGLSYYLSKDEFKTLIRKVSDYMIDGSTLIFDYPDHDMFTEKAGERAKKQLIMASGAGESMKGGYSYEELEEILTDSGLLIYEHLTPQEITKQYFNEYNKSNAENPIIAFDNVNYCLAVKKGNF